MERNNYYQCNRNTYEEHLSVFGKKVLQVLINKWNTKREYNTMNDHRIHHQASSTQNRKVLIFKDTNLHDAQPVRDGINSENEVNDSSFDCNFMVNKLPNVATSTELFKTVDYANDTNKTFDVIRGNLIPPVTDGDNYRNTVYDLNSKGSDDVFKSAIIKDNEDLNINENSHVNWSNMFDTELFPEVSDVSTELNELDQLDRLNKNINNNNHIKEIDKKASKRKNQKIIADVVPKKIKKKITQGDKIANSNSRKDKYRKAVKNWLNYVDSGNAVEEYIKNTKEKDEESIETAKKPKIAIDKFMDKRNKKVIQTQLTNKGGIMKFMKPQNKYHISQYSVITDNGPEVKDNVKVKKNKAKFVTPIKSQSSVINVTYEMHTVDTTNIEDFLNKLGVVQNTKIFIVLVYSNGFSQLNSHHTDDTSIPEGIIVYIEEQFYYFKGPEKKFKDILRQILESNKIICYEGKHILMYFTSQFDLETITFDIIDTKIGGCLLNPDNPPETFTELQGLLSCTPQFTIATKCVLQKTAWYITLLKECESKINDMLMEKSLWTVFVEIEMRLLPIIADMELRGVRIDLDRLKSMEDLLLTKMMIVEQQCHEAAGKVFQINSTVQVRAILYDELQLDTKCNVKIRETICKGAKSTSENMLRCLVSVHPLPRLILEYRHLHKAHATFLTGIAQHVKDGTVRPSWVQTAAATGRIASNNPNLQAIPKTPFSLVMFPEENDSDSQLLSFRSVYTSREGHTLLAADFKHVECRVFAHLSADTGLLDVLESRDDLFKVLAAKWLNKSETDISSADRERTKRIVYASLYGAGSRKLMDILGVSYEQALAVIASFNRTFPSLKSFGRCVVSRCERSGGRLSTLWGRARVFKNIASNDFALRSHAERKAVNFVVQGSAADLCKVAMIRASEALRTSSPPVRARLVLQIHDELVWEVRDHDLGRAAAIIKDVMENCGRECGMAALPVAMSAGHNWGQMAEYTGINSN